MTRRAAGAIPDEIDSGRCLYAARLNAWLQDAIRIGPGSFVLELAAGDGQFSLRLAERVRPGGLVLCTDLRPARVEEAARNARAAAAHEVVAGVIDMLEVGLPSESLDAVVCRWGLMFPLPTERALSEALRVLRPRGWLALATWGDDARNPWTTLADDAIRGIGLVPPDRHLPGQMLSLAQPQSVTTTLSAAGFVEIETEEVAVRWTYPDANTFWDVDVSWPGGPIEAFLQSLGGREIGRVRVEVERRLERFRAPAAGFDVPGLAVCAKAQRPA